MECLNDDLGVHEEYVGTTIEAKIAASLEIRVLRVRTTGNYLDIFGP